jgi:CNT family concentrative nucleoside transporter
MNIVSYFLEYNRYCNVIGIAVVLGIAVLFSHNRRSINYRLVFNALLMQFFIGFIVLRTTLGQSVVQRLANGINVLYACAEAGSKFVFGNLTNAQGPWGFVFAVNVLPIIVFFGAFMAVLFHWGIIQRCVNVIRVVVQPLLGTSGAETLCAVANSFLGQTEAPLLIRHYLHSMTRSEILVVMISGMATISGSILAVFAAMGVPAVHLLTASVMAVPAALLISKILYPEEEKPQTLSNAQAEPVQASGNIFSAIASGTSDGLRLALNVGAMLVAFLALLALINTLLGYVSIKLNDLCVVYNCGITIPVLSLNYFFSYVFAPFGYLLGFTGDEALKVGQLLGTKVTINELIAYSEMVKMSLSERTIAVLTYALCGFSNFSCIGIQIGGIGALVPEKRAWICEFGLLAVLGSSLANLLSAMIAGLLF